MTRDQLLNVFESGGQGVGMLTAAQIAWVMDWVDEYAQSEYDRGYGISQPSQCPYTFSHTKHWCGYDECRDS